MLAPAGSGVLSPSAHHGEATDTGGIASAHGSNAVLDAANNGIMHGGGMDNNNGAQVRICNVTADHGWDEPACAQ